MSINPYEAPQSVELPRAEEQKPNIPGPAWLGKALWVQFAAIVITFLAAPIPVAPEFRFTWDTMVIYVVGMIFLFSLMILITALRNRIGWFVVLELIVIVLPTTALLVAVFG